MLRGVLRRVCHLLKTAALVLSFIQLIIFLPLSLEHSQETFLTFSALLATFYFWLVTLRWLTHGTRFRVIASTLMVLQNFVIPTALFLCGRLYVPEDVHLRKSVPWLQSATSAQAWLKSRAVLPWIAEEGISYPVWLRNVLTRAARVAQQLFARVPAWYYRFLLHMSPVFSLLEGLSSLLVIQSFANFSRWLYVLDVAR